jgi:hypothetical protein
VPGAWPFEQEEQRLTDAAGASASEAKAKQKAKTDIAYCALLFKANRHRKAIAKLKKNVEVSLVPPSLQYSPLMTRKPN